MLNRKSPKLFAPHHSSLAMSDITVVVPVKNEAKNLGLCLRSIDGRWPVIVVDSDSVDETVAIAKSYGAEVLQFTWNGHFPKKRNWTLRNYTFETDWVLFLDADEYVTPAFVKEVEAAVQSEAHIGFWLNFSNYFMGQELRSGDSFRKLALFRVDAGEYEKIEEDNWSHLDMEVHEHPVLHGSIGEISARIEHNDFRGLKHYIAKHNEYSSWEAVRYLRLHSDDEVISKRSSEEWMNLTDRQKKKYRNLAKWWFAPAYFIVSYFFKKGFLDGAAGFHFALMKGVYFYQIYLKISAARSS